MTPHISQPIEFVWGAAVGIGLVVILCVTVLLTLLLALLKDIDLYVSAVRDEATGLAMNTATAPLLDDSVNEIQKLSSELAAHVKTLKAAQP